MEIDIDQGEIGMAIDTRALAVLGYKPVRVNVVIDGILSGHSQENIEVDEWTHVALFKIKVESLNEEVVDEFSEGVPISISVLDGDGDILERNEISKFFINSEHKSFIFETEKPRVLKPLQFNPMVGHLIQVVTNDKYGETSSVRRFLGGSTDYREGSPLEFWGSGPIQFNAYAQPDGNDPEHQIQIFYFEPQGDNTYLIRTAFEDSYLEYLESDDDEFNGWLAWNKLNTNFNGFVIEDKHKFVLDQTEDGYVKIRPFTRDEYLKFNYFSGLVTSDFYVSNEPDPESYDLKFRFLSASVKWEFEDQPTLYSAAIIPPTDQDFAFDQTIINCSSATGFYTVGTDKTEITTTSMDYEESFNLSASEGDVALSGEQIETQLVGNRFGGVITEIGSDFVLLNIRGSVRVKNYFQFKNNLNDVDGGCN